MRNAAVSGFVLGILGSVLDFTSGYLILSNVMITTNEMGMMITSYSSSNLAWSIGLFALGALLLLTSLASISSIGRTRMNLFGMLMLVYGIVMLLVGAAMFTRVAPMMTGYLASSVGMFVVGVLMVVNGSLMNRRMM